MNEIANEVVGGKGSGGSGAGGIMLWNPVTNPTFIQSKKSRSPNIFLLTAQLNFAIDAVQAGTIKGTTIFFDKDLEEWYSTASGSFKGDWDAGNGTLPTVNITQGDRYNVTVGGTVNGYVLYAGDQIVAKINNPTNAVVSGKLQDWSVIAESVSSVFGRTNNVVAQAGDYNINQITNGESILNKDADITFATADNTKYSTKLAVKTFVETTRDSLKGGVITNGDTLNKLYNLIIARALSSVTITTTNGLNGGGDLTSNRVISGVDATTGVKGVVQLSNTYVGTSESLATTEKALADGLANLLTTLRNSVPVDGNTLNKLNDKILAILATLTSDNPSLNTIQEIVDAIELIQNLINTKVDKVANKSLILDSEIARLLTIETGAEVNVQANYTQTDDTKDDFIKNKPTLRTASTKDVGSAIGQLQENGAILGNSEIVQTNENGRFITTAQGTAHNQNYSTVVSDIKANGVGSLGSLATLPRADHIHPTDTTREAIANKVTTFSVTPNDTNYLTEKAVKDALDLKVDKVANKSLILDSEIARLLTIETGAEVNVQADYAQTDNTQDSFIKNKPILGTVASKNVGTAVGNIQENGAILAASQTVETDANGKFITVAKNDAYNQTFGTGTNNVARGDASYSKADTYNKTEINTFNAGKNVKTWYVSGGINGTGLDTNNGYSPNNAFNTLSKLNTVLGSTGEQVVLLPSELTESVTFAQQNLEVSGQHASHRGICGTTGTITSNHSASSQTYSYFSCGSFVKQNAYIKLYDLNITNSFSDSGSGVLDAYNLTFNATTPISITGSGVKNFYNQRGGIFAINNASASVNVLSGDYISQFILIAGTLSIRNAIVYIADGTTFTLGSAGATIFCENVRFLYANNTPAKINAPSGLNYLLQSNCIFDIANSTLNGTDISGNYQGYYSDIALKSINLTSETASTLLGLDANKKIASLPISTYPSLAELINVKGTISPIQTQLNGKLTATNNLSEFITSGDRQVALNNLININAGVEYQVLGKTSAGNANFIDAVPAFTTSGRPALNASHRLLIWDTTINSLVYWNGATWNVIETGATATNLSVTYPNASQVYITPTTGATLGSVGIIDEATTSAAGTLSASNYTKLFYQRSFSFYIGSSGGNKKGVSVGFPINYPSVPNVSLTIKAENGFNDAFCISAQYITTNSLYCEIYRADGGNWGQQLYGFCFLSLS